MKKKMGIIALIVVAAAISAGVTWKLTEKKSSSAKSKSIVEQQYKESSTAEEAITKSILADGVIEYGDKKTYYVTEEGKKILKIAVKEGDIVKRGDTIAVFDDERLKQLEKQLKEEKITLETNKLAIEKLKEKDELKILEMENNINTYKQQINEFEGNIKNNSAQIELVETSLEKTNDDIKLNRELFNKGYAGKSDIKLLEDKAKEYTVTINKLKKENENIKGSIKTKEQGIAYLQKQIETENDKEKDVNIKYQIKTLEQSIEKNKLNIAEIEDDINNFVKTVYAEKPGVVSAVYIQEGQGVAKGKEIVDISDNRNIIITSNISEYDINKIEKGDKGKITGDALGKEYTAVITKIMPLGKIDSNGNTVIPIEMKILGLDKNLRNNYKVSIEITKDAKEKSMMVPLSAIIRDDNGKSYVMVLRERKYDENKESTEKGDDKDVKKLQTERKNGGNRPKKVEVVTGEIKGNMVEVTGLEPGMKVVEQIKSDNKRNQSTNPFAPGVRGAAGGPPGGFR